MIDEAHRFAPSDGSTSATAGVKALTAQGRKRGFTGVLASQRISKLHADVRGDVNNWILGRVGQTLDRNIMADQLGFTAKEGRENLRNMDPRSFWAFGPAISPEPILFRVDDAQTTVVKAGQAKVTTPPPPEALRDILAGLVVAPEPERTATANCEIAQVDDLRGQLATAQSRIEELEAEHCLDIAVGQRQLDELMNIIVNARRTLDAAFANEIPADGNVPEGGGVLEGDDQQAGAEQTIFAAPVKRQDEWTSGAVQTVANGNPLGVTAGETATSRPYSSPSFEGAKRDLPRAARKLLDALIRFHPRPLPIEHIAKVANVSMKSSQWRANYAAFQGSPYVHTFVGKLSVSAFGIATLALTRAPNSGEDLAQFWINALAPSTARMLRTLIDQPHPSHRDTIATASNMSVTSSAVGSGLKELCSLGLVVKRKNGLYQIAEILK